MGAPLDKQFPVPGESKSGIPKKWLFVWRRQQIQTVYAIADTIFFVEEIQPKIQSARDARVKTIPGITVH